MKYLSFCFALLLFTNIALAQQPSRKTNKGTLTVNISSIESEKGTIRVNIFRKEDDIFGKPYLLKLITPDTDGIKVAFENLPFSEYVVYVFHDKNNNKKMDHSWGLPAEPFGYSNNWKLTLFSGKPSYEKTKMTFSKSNTTVNIKLN